MIRRWPDASVFASAPVNASRTVHRADWTILDGRPIADQFPTVADLAQLWVVIRSEQQRGEQ